MVRKILCSLLCLFSLYGFATHNRAGEILYKRIAPFTATVGGAVVQVYTYSFTIVKYTNDGPNIADRCEDTLYFGDGTRGIAQRINGLMGSCGCGNIRCGEVIINETINNVTYRVKKNIYTIVHTYPGPGFYKVSSLDPNRNQDVINIPNSVNQPFYIESYLVITAFTGANTSPTFHFDPTDRACLKKCFYHDPGAYDVDGDSLSYEITWSRGQGGGPVPGYTYPETGGGTYGIDPVTGILTWCTPQLVGEYNIAFIVREWRKNTSGHYQLVGYVLRDMQVVVLACNNEVPFIELPPSICVEAGSVITQSLTVSDPNAGNTVTVSGGGGAFDAPFPSATLTNTGGVVPFTTNFTWSTTCTHIRQQPYICIFKVQDAQAPVKLTYFGSWSIRVVPPSVKNVSATPLGSEMRITWSPSACNPSNNPIVAYKIYRKTDCAPVAYDPCITGVTPTLGFTYVGQAPATATLFVDNNNGNGLTIGQDYGYVVVAQYSDGSQSFASTQVCAKLRRDVPILLNVDVMSTSVSDGSVFVRWEKPLTNAGNLDTIALPGPYEIRLRHRAGASGNLTTVHTTTAAAFYQLSVTFTHTGLNTVETDHQYLLEFTASNTLVGSSQKATSVFLSAVPGDRKVDLSWTATTPWINQKYFIYRKMPGASSFILRDSTSQTRYTDKDSVRNRADYCYYIRSKGEYSDNSITKPLYNRSQQVCATPRDLVAPCTPTIAITANCPAGTVRVDWSNVTLSCSDDVIKYVLFKKETIDEAYVKLDTIYGAGSTSFAFDELNLISSCFAIQAVDSSGNASPLSTDYCVDNCPEFELPNIITLNGDNVNDFFKAIKVRQIKEITLHVFDRWGNLVYETTDPYFRWNGISILTNRIVSEGTLFYVCDVYEPRVSGIKKRQLKGYLQVVH